MTPFEEIAHLHDVPIALEIELDRKIVTLRELLNIEAGGVLRMTRSAGENIDIYIGGVLCSTGEIVVIETALGVRITDFRDDVYYAALHLQSAAGDLTLDSRPSDAIALAIRAKAPVFAEDRVFEKSERLLPPPSPPGQRI